MDRIDWQSRIGRRLRLRDLHVFFAVVETRSMAKAAARLRIKQPSVSKAIGDLEAALGVRLFDRSPRGVEPTIYGDALLKSGVAAFDDLRQGIRSIEFLSDPMRGELRIGCVPSMAATVIPSVIQSFLLKYPRTTIHMDEVALPAQLMGLRDRRFDFTITRLGPPLTGKLDDDLNVETVFHDQLVVASGHSNKWARRRRIDLIELVNEPWILAESNTWNYTYLAEAFQARGLNMPAASLVTLSTHLVAQLLATGQYVTAFPGSWVRFNSFKILPVELPVRPWPLAILRLKNRLVSPVVERFLACFRAHAQQLSAARKKGHPRADAD
jgi:DNA-binding transcriptional LysR family regulator